MRNITRREFIKSTASAGVALTLAGPYSRVRGANDAIRVAVVGINGRGGSHISAFGNMEGVRVAALCDVDKRSWTAWPSRSKKQRESGHIRRYPQAAGRQEHRRHLHRDAEPLALAGARSGPARRAKTSTWRSRAATTSSRAVSASRPPANTSGSCSTARRAVPAASWAKQVAAIASGKYGKLLVSKACGLQERVRAMEHRL